MSPQPGPAWLFCPADRPDRFDKAAERADVVILDLEDAVAVDRKEVARAAIAGYPHLDPERFVVRVNGAGTPEHEADRRLVADLGVRVLLAKTESAESLAAFADNGVLALIETPRGLLNVEDIAAAPGLVGMMWGADDLVAGLGGTASRHADGRYRDVARYARARTLVAAKAFDVLALDAVYMDFADLDGFRAECTDAVASGFDATAAIHPTQVPVIREAYRPSADAVAWASGLLTAVGNGAGVTTYEGRMVDAPIFRQAERILRRAGDR